MNQDQYLQRLRIIRQKYSSTNKPAELISHDLQLRPAFNQQSYPRFQNPSPSQVKPSFEQLKPIYSQPERPYCMVEQSIVIPQQQGGNGYDNKRMQNFNTFIQDLDKRIVEKERALSSKFRNNKPNIKLNGQQQPQSSLARHYSTFNIHQSIDQPSRIIPRQSFYERSLERREEIPREAYSRSLPRRQPPEYRKPYNPQVENGILQRKWAQDNYSNQKLKILNGCKDTKPKTSQPMSFGLSKNENIANSDNWSLGKLDSIQQRIKSVLQRK